MLRVCHMYARLVSDEANMRVLDLSMLLRVGVVGAAGIALAAGLLAQQAPVSHRSVAQVNVPSLSRVLAVGSH